MIGKKWSYLFCTRRTRWSLIFIVLGHRWTCSSNQTRYCWFCPIIHWFHILTLRTRRRSDTYIFYCRQGFEHISTTLKVIMEPFHHRGGWNIHVVQSGAKKEYIQFALYNYNVTSRAKTALCDMLLLHQHLTSCFFFSML